MSLTHRAVAASMGEAEVTRRISGVVAGQRMAGHEPSETDIEFARRQLRGELSLDEATEQALAATEAHYYR